MQRRSDFFQMLETSSQVTRLSTSEVKFVIELTREEATRSVKNVLDKEEKIVMETEKVVMEATKLPTRRQFGCMTPHIATRMHTNKRSVCYLRALRRSFLHSKEGAQNEDYWKRQYYVQWRKWDCRINRCLAL